MSQTLLICDDDADIRLALSLMLADQGYNIIEADSPKAVVTSAQRNQPDVILLDMNFSRDTTSGQEGLWLIEQLKPLSIPIILMTAWGSIELAVKGLNLGANDFIEKPWNKDRLLKSIQQQVKLKQLTSENKTLKQLLIPSTSSLTWSALSPSMKKVDELIRQIAPTDANLLILGENGTGKSLLAQRVHQLSARAEQPLVQVNMAAIPHNLFESELFGHQKGAFTDAKSARIGRFQLSENSTLFLDEIGTLPLALQPKLLRVLETGQYEIVGSSTTQQSNARIISATNADLSSLVTGGEFRQDLLYRLNTFVIKLPPLRERQQDIKPLTQVFIKQLCDKYNKPLCVLSTSALAKLITHQWPGNIRELQHVIERAVLLCNKQEIDDSLILIDHTEQPPTALLTDSDLHLEQHEKRLINRAIEISNGHITDAAKLLGISRNSLYRRLEKHEINHDT
ncbi:sigma-54-dependent transcriptional regulator [Psychrobium sp. nBUS_13]|uniref:sigma-54-dependent transcriptional regulator n=1 Tax=Psychrobium sp. nBUS_13 TaxID=3395319 RepID=UPI003EBFF4A5